MKKYIIIMFLLSVYMITGIAKSRKLPNKLLPLNTIRRHTNLKKIFSSPGWKILPTNSISSGILTIKNQNCFVKWNGELLPVAFSCEEMGKPESLLFNPKKISKLKNNFQLVFELKM